MQMGMVCLKLRGTSRMVGCVCVCVFFWGTPFVALLEGKPQGNTTMLRGVPLKQRNPQGCSRKPKKKRGTTDAERFAERGAGQGHVAGDGAPGERAVQQRQLPALSLDATWMCNQLGKEVKWKPPQNQQKSDNLRNWTAGCFTKIQEKKCYCKLDCLWFPYLHVDQVLSSQVRMRVPLFL